MAFLFLTSIRLDDALRTLSMLRRDFVLWPLRVLGMIGYDYLLGFFPLFFMFRT